MPHFVCQNEPSFFDSAWFISQVNNIHFPLFPPLLTLCTSSTHSISLIFSSTVSSVCSLIDRMKIKINICTIPTLHPLVSIRSSPLTLGLDKASIHPILPSIPGTSPFRMTEQRWASKMRDETRRGRESFLPQGFGSEQLIGDTYHYAVLCFHIFFFLWRINRKVQQYFRIKVRERENVKYSIAATNCKLAIDFPSMW